MVSFGPYHHGSPELGMAEEFKHEVLTMFVSSSGKDKEFFYCQIFKVIDQIRDCFVGVSREVCDDAALAEMMLLDACFAIYPMEITLRKKENFLHFRQHFGMALMTFPFHDMRLLDNQIPLWDIKIESYTFYGKLQLSIWVFTPHFKQLFIQMIACEGTTSTTQKSLSTTGRKRCRRPIETFGRLLWVSMLL
ncbi:Hypothetical predicted protein [Olea europaea subsp. europaea]|uniref:Uncharacterized protein n=1 Tax=Olea europaea subsp. europaea TaxID=158383 RepID=A0A8S0SRN0_OLEEU|nr:Hypothetical predicted protein [Olea europaea subsp. europaea]